jgi:hypothetical protein
LYAFRFGKLQKKKKVKKKYIYFILQNRVGHHGAFGSKPLLVKGFNFLFPRLSSRKRALVDFGAGCFRSMFVLSKRNTPIAKV